MVQGTGAHSHQYLVVAQLRIGNVLILQNFGPTKFVEAYSPHRSAPRKLTTVAGTRRMAQGVRQKKRARMLLTLSAGLTVETTGRDSSASTSHFCCCSSRSADQVGHRATTAPER